MESLSGQNAMKLKHICILDCVEGGRVLSLCTSRRYVSCRVGGKCRKAWRRSKSLENPQRYSTWHATHRNLRTISNQLTLTFINESLTTWIGGASHILRSFLLF